MMHSSSSNVPLLRLSKYFSIGLSSLTILIVNSYYFDLPKTSVGLSLILNTPYSEMSFKITLSPSIDTYFGKSTPMIVKLSPLSSKTWGN